MLWGGLGFSILLHETLIGTKATMIQHQLSRSTVSYTSISTLFSTSDCTKDLANSRISRLKDIFFELQARSGQPLSPQVLGHVENLKQDWPRFSVACWEFQTFLILLMDLFTCIYPTWRGVIQTNWHKLSNMSGLIRLLGCTGSINSFELSDV